MPRRLEDRHGSPHQAEQSAEYGPSPGFVHHVQSVKFKLQVAIVPKAEWGDGSEGFMVQLGVFQRCSMGLRLLEQTLAQCVQIQARLGTHENTGHSQIVKHVDVL